LNFLTKTIAFVFYSYVFTLNNVAQGQVKPIEMIAGLSKPPFVIAEDDGGMQLEIIEAAFAKSNQIVRFTYLPLNRHMDVLHHREFDGIITLSEHENEWGICLSKPYIVYQNVVVTLTEPANKIEGFSDLAKLKVAAFQNATRFLGKEYYDVFKGAANYTEIANQKSQVNLLFSGRVDALVMDINIFKHLLANQRLQEPQNTVYKQEFFTHFLFKPRAYTAGFKDKSLCALFDQGINSIIADGSYQEIIDSYLYF